ncbi:CynX/NimT family MFS transporter [Rhizohabitans arisaemae]|uniref:MFS transporter n=1 Tax=Rhizohabitans arisaemae TaxID=2720610 RepID=UPI0024B12690|nr:MFS transporter [Rhizohabitans arisaemae]
MSGAPPGKGQPHTGRHVIAPVYLAGLSAGVALGRFIPLEAGLRADFGLSPVEFGWLVSMITVAAALLAMPVGVRLARGDLGAVLAAGLAVMLVAGTIQAVGSSLAVLYGARALEGLGYLLVVVTGPLVLAACCDPETERVGLAVWSTFIPVGIALAAVAGAAGNGYGWRAAAGLTLLPCALAFGATWPRLRGTVETSQDQAAPTGGSGPLTLLSLGFSLIALLSVSVLALLPGLGADQGVGPAAGGTVTAVVSLASVPGGLLAGGLMAKGGRPRSLAMTALVMPVAALAVFSANAWWAVTTGAAVLLVANGLVLAVMYATVPLLADSPGRLRQGYGLLVQAGSVGTVLGPPAFGLAVTQVGWLAGIWLVTVVTVLGLGLFLAAARRRPDGS